MDFLELDKGALETDRSTIRSNQEATFGLEMTPHSVYYISDIDNRLIDVYFSNDSSRPLYDTTTFPKTNLNFKSRDEAGAECLEFLKKIGAPNYQISDIITIDKSTVERIDSLLSSEVPLSKVFTQDDEGYNILLEQVVPELNIAIYEGQRLSDRQKVADAKSKGSLSITKQRIYNLLLSNPLDFTIEASTTQKLLSEDQVRQIITDYEDTLLDGPKIEIKSLSLKLQLPLQPFGEQLSDTGTLQYVWVLSTSQVSDTPEKNEQYDQDVVIDAQTGEILYGM